MHAAVARSSGRLGFGHNGTVDDGAGRWGRIPVPAWSIDDLADHYEVPDVVFIDVEGFEHQALLGAARTLEGGPDWFVEVHANEQGKLRRGLSPPGDRVLRSAALRAAGGRRPTGADPRGGSPVPDRVSTARRARSEPPRGAFLPDRPRQHRSAGALVVHRARIHDRLGPRTRVAIGLVALCLLLASGRMNTLAPRNRHRSRLRRDQHADPAQLRARRARGRASGPRLLVVAPRRSPRPASPRAARTARRRGGDHRRGLAAVRTGDRGGPGHDQVPAGSLARVPS